MLSGLIGKMSLRAILSGTAVFVLAVTPANAQQSKQGEVQNVPANQVGDTSVQVAGGRPAVCPPPPCPAPLAMPAVPQTIPTPQTAPGTPTPTPESPELDLLAGSQGAAGRPVTLPGYIDTAIVRSQFFLRYDSAYNANRPDRAEFFYAKCGCFGAGAPGPPLPETRVNYQDITSYLELAANNRFSAFVEAPVRFLNPEQNANAAGFADMNAGIKAALIASTQEYLTFQCRTYIPTGDARRGLGTHHASLEPAMLFYEQFGDRTILVGEFRDWIPIGGTDFAGNVLRYGLGVGYFVLGSPAVLVAPTGTSRLWAAPIAEFVGWTVLGGKEFGFPDDQFTGPRNAAGDTIVNAKVGVRAGVGDYHSLYVGYGRALTGDVWYTDILRLEYRLAF